MQNKNIVRPALVTAGILLIPFFGNIYVDGWKWGPLDFVVAGAFLFGTGVAYELISKKGGTAAYRIAVGIACAAALLLLWVNAAAGIIGDGPVNLMYFGVVAVLIIGAFLARLQPRQMALAPFATAIAQLLVPVIALVIFNPPFDPGIAPVFALNACFAMAFAGSALLFRRAARSKTQGEEPGPGASQEKAAD